MKSRGKQILLFFNIITLVALIYFTFTNYYSWTTHSVWLNSSYYSYEIRTDVKLLIVLSAILPTLLALSKRMFIWLIQPLLIILLITNFKSDFLQKTVFINQPTSIQKTNRVIEKFIKQNENEIRLIVQVINN
jgi:hypothetical protein